jgi:hypothetical protein
MSRAERLLVAELYPLIGKSEALNRKTFTHFETYRFDPGAVTNKAVGVMSDSRVTCRLLFNGNSKPHGIEIYST